MARYHPEALRLKGLSGNPWSGLSIPHIAGVNFIFMEDMLRIQALFAARQFLTARCLERGLHGVAEGNPFIAGTNGTIACLHSELSLLSATLGTVSSEMLLGARRIPAQKAYSDFVSDLLEYAPWIRFPDGASDLHALVRQSQAKLRALQDEHKHTIRLTALVMGLHPRLGAGSMIEKLGRDIVVAIANILRDQ